MEIIIYEKEIKRQAIKMTSRISAAKAIQDVKISVLYGLAAPGHMINTIMSARKLADGSGKKH